jgi:hypothetical protein
LGSCVGSHSSRGPGPYGIPPLEGRGLNPDSGPPMRKQPKGIPGKEPAARRRSTAHKEGKRWKFTGLNARPSPEARRALELLAVDQRGLTETLLRTYGFTQNARRLRGSQQHSARL